MATQLFKNYILFLLILIAIFMLTMGALMFYSSINYVDSSTAKYNSTIYYKSKL